MNYTDEQLSAAIGQWTPADIIGAASEGWTLSIVDHEIACEQIDKLPEGHVDAWLLLMTGTKPHHAKARAILESLDPKAWAKLVELFNSIKGRH